MQAAHEAGQDVARLHSGDLSIWSATGEQMRRLDALAIPYSVTPGVPAFAAAAATLKREVDPAGAGAVAGADADLGPGLGHAGARAARDLRRLGRDAGDPSLDPCRRAGRGRAVAFYGEACPVAIVFRASWPDERVLRGTLSTIAAQVRESGLERTALILVGPALAAEDFGESALYSTGYDRRFRPGGGV